MLKVNVRNNRDVMNLLIHIHGHADAGEYGHDLVCSASSILAYTLAEDVEEAEESEMVTDVIIALDSGEATIGCTCKSKEAYGYMKRAFKLVWKGYKLLADNHPQNVTVNDW